MFFSTRNTHKVILSFVTMLVLIFLPLHNLHAKDMPSREDLIRAVQNNVSGKFFEKTSYEFRQEFRTCSQSDVDFDINAQRNPELAKCPYVGARYSSNKRVPVKKRYKCKQLPNANLNWSVRRISTMEWRVSIGKSSWNFTNLGSKSVNENIDEGVIYIRTRESRNAFMIVAHQEC